MVAIPRCGAAARTAWKSLFCNRPGRSGESSQLRCVPYIAGHLRYGSATRNRTAIIVHSLWLLNAEAQCAFWGQ